MNVIFKVEIDKNGLLEMTTAELSEENFYELRRRLFGTKRIIIETKAKGFGTSLCATINDEKSYVPYQSPGEKTQ